LTFVNVINIILDADAVISNLFQKVGGSNAYQLLKVGGSGPPKKHIESTLLAMTRVTCEILTNPMKEF